MHLTFSADIQAADEESRTLAGQIVPFGKPGNTSAGKVIFAEGSFVELDPKSVKLLLEHDGTKPIGKAIEFSITETGIDGKFKVSKTTRGTDTIIEAQDGLRTGFSVGANVLDYEIDKKGVMTVMAAELVEVSVVSRPAFGADAQITEVAATESEVAESVEEETTVENTNPEVVVEDEVAPVVEASAPAPIYTKPRVKTLTDAEAFAHAVYAAAGNEESKRILVEAADDTANNTGFTLSRGLPQFISNTFEGRPAVEAIGGASALPATGLSYTIPNLTQAPEVDVEGELDPIVQTDMESDYITIDVVKVAGNQIVSWELLDRSDPSFGELMLRELRRAYAKRSDEYLLAELLAGGSSATVQAADWKGLQAFVATEVPVAYNATGGLIANQLVGSTAWWSELIGAVDNEDRPVFNAIAPSNASGNVGISSPIGSVFGATFRADHNISTVGLVDNSAFLVAPDAVGFWESPSIQLRTNVLTDGSVQVSLYGYVAAKVLKPSGVRKYQA